MYAPPPLKAPVPAPVRAEVDRAVGIGLGAAIGVGHGHRAGAALVGSPSEVGLVDRGRGAALWNDDLESSGC